jgi:hypothetical protein
MSACLVGDDWAGEPITKLSAGDPLGNAIVSKQSPRNSYADYIFIEWEYEFGHLRAKQPVTGNIVDLCAIGGDGPADTSKNTFNAYWASCDKVP